MSEEHAVAEVVDEFGSGFAGEEVLVSPETLEQEDVISNLLDTPDAVQPAAPAAFQLTNEQYLDLVNGVQESRAFRDDASRKLDTALGKIGGTERLIQQIQSATPKGEIPELTSADMGQFAEDFPHINESFLPALNKVLKNVKGTGGPAIVDPNVVSTMVEERVLKLVPTIREQVKTQITQDMELEKTIAAHKDAKEIFANPDYFAWAKTLPAEEQKIVMDSWNSAEVIPMLTRYKAFKKPPAASPAPQVASRTAALKAAVNPASAGAVSPKALTDDDQFAAGYNSELAAAS